MSTDYLSYLSDSQQNRMHFAGAATGLDINSMIDAEMTKASEPVKKLQEEEQSLTNRQTALQNVSDRLDEFRTFVNDWKLQSNFFHNDATSSDEDILTVTTSGSIRDTTFDVTVDNLAKNQSYFSTSSVSAETTTRLENLGGTGNGIAGAGTLSINVNGTAYEVDYYEGNTLEEITEQIEGLDDNLQVYAVNSSDGLKLFFSGTDAGVNLQMSDSGTLLESLNMTESHKSGGFVLGDPEATMDTFGISDTAGGQLTINVDGTDYAIDYDPTSDDFDSWITNIYGDSTYDTMLEKVSIYYGSNGQTGDDEAMKLFINSKNPESDVTVTETGDGNMLEMMRFFETYASAERVTGASTDMLDTVGVSDSGDLVFTVDGTDYTIGYDVTTDDLATVVSAINGEAGLSAKVSANIVEDGGEMQLILSAKDNSTTFEVSDTGSLLRDMNMTEEFESTSAVTGADTDYLADFGTTEDSGTISINIDGSYRYVNYDASATGDTLAELVNKINAADSRIYAEVEDLGGTLNLKIGSTEPDVNISLSDSGDVLETLNIDTTEANGHHSNGYTATGHSESGFQEAQQATATVNFGGIETEITSDTNTFTNVLQGINFTARQESTTPVTVTVTQNIEDTKEHIMDFVNEYNDLMDYLYERLYAEDDRVETSSTASEEDETDEESDELADVLVGDPLLRSVFEELKSMAYQDLDGSAQEVYYSNTMSGTEESTLYDLGVRLPSGSAGTLTIHVDGFDDPIEMTYSEDDTVEDIVDRMALYGDYNVNATIEENGSGSFVFKISSPNDIIVTDTATTGYSGLKSILLTNHGDTSLKYDYLTEIGVGSSDGFSDYTNNYRNIMRGRLSINEGLLESALRTDSEAVWETFGISTTIAGTEMKGLATQLSDKIYDYNTFNTGKIQRIIGYNGTIAQEVRRINSEIIDWSSRLNRKFEALWAKYSSLEQTISRLQEQGTALQNAFTNLNGGN